MDCPHELGCPLCFCKACGDLGCAECGELVDDFDESPIGGVKPPKRLNPAFRCKSCGLDVMSGNHERCRRNPDESAEAYCKRCDVFYRGKCFLCGQASEDACDHEYLHKLTPEEFKKATKYIGIQPSPDATLPDLLLGNCKECGSTLAVALPTSSSSSKQLHENPEWWTDHEERMYQHIVDSVRKHGRTYEDAKRIAAATVNKWRSQHGLTKAAQAQRERKKRK